MVCPEFTNKIPNVPGSFLLMHLLLVSNEITLKRLIQQKALVELMYDHIINSCTVQLTRIFIK